MFVAVFDCHLNLFEDCRVVRVVETFEGVTEIGKYAFIWCKSLASVVIPPSVTEIGSHAFYGCKSLETMEFGGTAMLPQKQ